MGNIIFEIKNRAENAINMHDKSEFKEPPDMFEMIQVLEEQLRLHEEDQQEQKQFNIIVIKEKAEETELQEQ
jgi:hypothetical protein